MIWATVSSQSCFCWLYRASPSLAAKNYNQSDFGVDHPVMSMCRVFSCVVGRGCLLWPVHSFVKTLLAFALLRFVLQGQICLLLQVFVDFLLLHSSPLWWNDIFFGVLVLEGLVDLRRTIRLQLLQHYWYCDTELFALYMNRDRSVILEIASKYCISDSFVDYDGYSSSFKGFLPTILDIMVIWVKFTYSSPF